MNSFTVTRGFKYVSFLRLSSWHESVPIKQLSLSASITLISKNIQNQFLSRCEILMQMKRAFYLSSAANTKALWASNELVSMPS